MNGKGEFAYCPIFDNGAALLADTKMDYPLEEDPQNLIGQVQSKTITQDFEEQLELSEMMYGMHLKFSFTEQDVKNILAFPMIWEYNRDNTPYTPIL